MTTTNHVAEPKNETLQSTDTYRAPRLVPLGTAVGLVQGGIGLYKDDPSNPIQGRHG
jgi:hypothetical protein